MKTLLTATALILSMTAAANAVDTAGSDVLAGGPIISANETTFYCFYMNFGATSITPSAQLLYSFDGTTTNTVTAGTSCKNGIAVAANKACWIFASGPLSGFAYSCAVTFDTAAKHVRGAAELGDSSGNVQSTVELH
jgi:hypothetical protein